MNTVILLIPGLFDVSMPSLGGQTPLEKANTPYLDEIAQLGQWIKVESPPGGVENTLLELFGLESTKTHLALSSLVAYSRNLPFKINQTAFLFQGISLFDNQVVSCDPALLRDSELKLVCQEINQTFESWIHMEAISESSGVCLIREPFKSCELQDKEPLKEGAKYSEVIHPYFFQNKRLEKLEEIHKFLENHSVNAVRQDFEELPCNAFHFQGIGAPLNAITSKNFYKRFCLLASSPATLGLSNLLEIKKLDVGAKESIHYLSEIPLQAQEAIHHHKTLILEIDEVLKSTLQGHLLEKIKRIEFIDKMLIKPLLDLCTESHLQLIISPLKTSNIQKQSLTEGEVPWVVYNPRHRKGLEPILSFKESQMSKIQGRFSTRSLASQFLY